MKGNTFVRRIRLATWTVAGGLLLCALPAGARPLRPVAEVVPVEANYAGKSYADWSVAWWQHVLSLPSKQNPLLDGASTCQGVDQSGPVYFLCGTWGATGSAYRYIGVPEGTALFFPVLNAIYDNGGFEAPGPEPTSFTIPQLRALMAPGIENQAGLYALVNDRPIANLAKYRVVSPAFSYDLPTTDNLWEKAYGLAGYHFHGSNLAVADGYYVMIKPLPVGQHVVSFGVRGQMNVTYIVIVTAAVVP